MTERERKAMLKLIGATDKLVSECVPSPGDTVLRDVKRALKHARRVLYPSSPSEVSEP